MHYYEFNIKDYRAKTAHLSPTEHYVYRSLIDWYYLNEKPFPCDLEKIARLLMLPTNELQSLQNVLDEFFVIKKLKGDPCECYHHRRIDKEVVNYKHNKRGKSTNTTNTTSQTTNESTNNLQTTTNATTNQGTNKNTTDSKKAVFIEALKNQGIKANTRMTIGELQALFDKHCSKLQMTTNETTNATNAISPPNNHKPLTNNHKPLTNINNTHTQTSEEKNSPVENQPQSEKTKAEIIREQRADELENWQPPTLEEISSQLFRIGFEINITQAQYESHVQDFKAYYIEQALYGKPLNTEALRKSKLRAWLQNAMQKQKTNHNSNSTGVKNATHQQNRTKRTTRPEYTDKLEQQRQTYFTQSTVGERTMRDVYPVENVVSQQNECR